MVGVEEGEGAANSAEINRTVENGTLHRFYMPEDRSIWRLCVMTEGGCHESDMKTHVFGDCNVQ